MPRSHFLKLLTGILGALLAAEVAAAPAPGVPSPPNILLIVADDMGFSDIGSYGGEIETPNLDRLANNGVRYTQFYTGTRCWPTRATLMTGYYPQAIRRDILRDEERGEYGMFGKVSGANGVRPRWAQLLPAHLKSAGYRSYHSGKWHIDGDRLPAGFDRSYSLEDHNRFFSPANHLEDDRKLPPVAPDSGYYATRYIADHAIKCLTEHAKAHPGQPFFEFLAFTAPHFPLQALPEDIALYQGRYDAGWDAVRAQRFARMKRMGLVTGDLPPPEPAVNPRWNLTDDELRRQISPDEMGGAVPWASLNPAQQRFQASKMAVHAAMVHRMDIEIGRVLAKIEAMGQLDNTLVLFMSDNGASPEQILRGDGHDSSAPLGSARTYLGLGAGWSTASNTPFRLHKAYTHEGGSASPLIVSWPARIGRSGGLRTTPAHAVDIVPTLLEVTGATVPATHAGMPVPPLHGKSLVPSFDKDARIARDCLWWYHDGNRALRAGDWKIVANFGEPWELYDLSVDRTEAHNLASAHPAKVKELEALWNQRAAEFAALAGQDLPAEAAQPAIDPNARPAAPAATAEAAAPTTVAFKLKLRPGTAAEYARRHASIWPELSSAIKAAGISNYSIFLDEQTDTLFAVQSIAPKNTAAELRKTEIMHKWWDYMAPLMEVNPDNSPVRVPLKQVYHQD